jgi:hypothetical protein
MKTYPSIVHPLGKNVKPIKGPLHTFDKIDGSNLRFEWSRSKGWYKYGTRRRLFDVSDPIFGPAIALFHSTLAEQLEIIIRQQKWISCVIFCEYYGPNSFAGIHEPNDEMKLVVIDVAPYKQGILEPKAFLKLFGPFGPKYFGLIDWNATFRQRITEGLIGGVSFEGVVGKRVDRNRLMMYKCKSQAWYDRVYEKYGLTEGKKLAES